MYDSDIHIFSKNGDLYGFNELIAAGGVDINESGEYGDTPLHYASDIGHLEVVNVLVAAGAEVNKTNVDGNTPLHDASRNGHLEVVKALIRAKADVRIENDQGQAPVDIARTNEIRQYIHEHHPWQRRRPLILTRPHDDHESNKAHKLKALGNIVTATSSSNEPSSHDDILFQIKLKVASFL